MKKYIVTLFLYILTGCSDEHKNKDLQHNTNYKFVQEKQNYSEQVDNNSSQNVSKVNTIYSDDVFLGNKNAPVKIIFFFSTTCPACAYFFKNIIPQIKSDFVDKNKVVLIFREAIHSQKELYTSMLSRCTGNTDDYMKIMNMILSSQGKWVLSKEYYKYFSEIAFIHFSDSKKFDKCLIQKDLKDSLFMKSFTIEKTFTLNFTPAFIIDGKVWDMKNKYSGYKSLSDEINNIIKNKSKNNK